MRYEVFNLPPPYVFKEVKSTYVVTRPLSYLSQRDVLAMLLHSRPSPTLIVVYVEREHRHQIYKDVVAHFDEANDPSLMLVLEDTTRFTDDFRKAAGELETLLLNAFADTAALAVAPLLSNMYTQTSDDADKHMQIPDHIRVFHGAAVNGWIFSQGARTTIAQKVSSVEGVESVLFRLTRCVAPLAPLAYGGQGSEKLGPSMDSVGMVRRWCFTLRHLLRALESEVCYRQYHLLGQIGGVLPAACVAVCFALTVVMWSGGYVDASVERLAAVF